MAEIACRIIFRNIMCSDVDSLEHFILALRTSQVVVLAAHWGDCYYHFIIEGLPRIMPVLDVLLEHQDIKVRCTGDPQRTRYGEETVDVPGRSKLAVIVPRNKPPLTVVPSWALFAGLRSLANLV